MEDGQEVFSLTMVHVEFGGAHCLARLGEEAPESVIGGLLRLG